MKNLLLSVGMIVLMAVSSDLVAQNVSINSTGSNPDTSAMLDVSSTTTGVLLPRMTTAQRNAIVTPATGLTIFNTTLVAYQFNSGTPAVPVWSTLNSGGGSVSSVSVTTVNGVSGAVAMPTTTPAISLTLGNITPTSVAASGSMSGSNLSGTNTGDQTITLTGDVTGSGTGSFPTTIGANKVSNAKLATVPVNTIKGAIVAGDPIDLTGTQATTILNTFTTALKGLAPASGGGTSNFLRADGTWAAPSTTNQWSTTGNSGTSASTNFIGTTDAIDFVAKANNTERMRITSAGLVGFNSPNPTYRIQLEDAGGPNADIATRLYNANNLSYYPTMQLQVSAGTRAAPSAVISNTLLGGVHFAGFDGATWNDTKSVAIQSRTSQNWTTSAHGSFMSLFTVPNGSILAQERMRIDQSGNVGINTTAFNATYPEKFIVDNGASGNTNYQNVIVGKGNTNSYAQLNIQNGNAGTGASSDVVATADNGNETVNYIDMGMNSSANTSTGVLGGVNTAYLYGTGNDFAIGNATTAKSLVFFTGGTGTNERMRIDGNGNVGIGTTSPSTALHVVGTNPLTLIGVQAGTATSADSLLTITSGLVKKLPVSTFASAFATGNLTEISSGVLTITGGSNSVIGSGTTIQVKQANGSQSGFLSTTDWNTFNSKLSTVDTTNINNFSTKVRSLFSATAPITYGNGLIGITQSSTSANGYLSSTDWNTFNNKQPAGSYLTANQTISFAPTGDVTGSTTGTNTLAPALVIGANKVTNTTLAQMPTLTIKGNNTVSTANAGDLTVAQVNAILPVFSTLQGLVPGTASSATNFLRADGTWAVPAASGWTTTGNSGTTSSTNFIGTTDYKSFKIKTNSLGAYHEFLFDSLGNVGIGNSLVFDATNRDKLLVDAGAVSTNVITGTGNINNYLQLNIQNQNNGNNASSDIVATANNGSANSVYIDMGINSQGYANGSTNILNGPNVAYLYATGSDFFIGNGANAKDLIFFTNSSGITVADGTERMRITSAATLPGANDVFDLGSTSKRWKTIYAQNALNTSSDRRLKTNIANLTYGLKEVMAMQPVSYNWKTTPDVDKKLGLIAQDVRKIVPEVVKGDESKETLSIAYSDLIPVLINAVKEQQEQIDMLKNEIQLLKNKK